MPRKNDLFLFQTDPGGGSGGAGGTGDGDPGDPAPQPPAGDDGDPGGTGDDTVPAAKLKEAQNEARNLRARLKAAEKERDELKGTQQSDVEKLTTERDNLRESLTEAEQRVRKLSVAVLAESVGIVKEARADAADLLDWSKIQDPSDDEEVTEALRALVKAKPFLAGSVAGGGDGGAGQGGNGQKVDMNTLIRQAAGRA